MTHSNSDSSSAGAQAPLRQRTGRRLFVGLLVVTSVVLCFLLCVSWIIPYVGFGNIHSFVPYFTGALLALLLAVIVWATVGLVLYLTTKRSFLRVDRVRGLTIKFFLPLVEALASLVGIERKNIRHSFIAVNNELVLDKAATFAPKDVLILTPHCLQRSDCKCRLTYSIENCARCGLCPIACLMGLRDHYGVNLAVATGGSIARRVVVQQNPKFIIAVACERDLVSGIQDTYPLVVYGVLNERPHGPCCDTWVSCEEVEAVLRRFLLHEGLPPIAKKLQAL